jgi:hypothetical protein
MPHRVMQRHLSPLLILLEGQHRAFVLLAGLRGRNEGKLSSQVPIMERRVAQSQDNSERGCCFESK